MFEEHALAAGEATGKTTHVGDPSMGDDELGLRIGLHEPRKVVRDRRKAATAVDEDRHTALGCELEHRRKPLVVQQKALRARV